MKKVIFIVITTLILGNPIISSANDTLVIKQEPEPTPPYEAVVKARHVVLSCQKYFINTFNTRENIARKATCNGYFFGIGGLLLTLQMSDKDTGVCLPDSITTTRIIKHFLEWSVENQDKMDMPAAESVVAALAGQYPCG